MNFGVITAQSDFSRIPVGRDTVHRITIYGTDNLYPQRMQNIMLLSPITKSAVNLRSSFIRGNGFENGDLIINRFNETANDILRRISFDKSMFDGFGLHLNSNALNVVKEVQHVEFPFIRLGLANQNGQIKNVMVSNNWEQSNHVLPTSDLNTVKYQIFDHEQNGREALTTARGMLLYNTPTKNKYPLATNDAIAETCVADHELAVFELSNIVNGFLSMSVFKYPTSGNTEEEEEELRKKLNQLRGARNSNSVIVAGIDEDYEGSGNLVEQIPANNNDSLFINTTLNVKNRIIQNYNVPNSIMGMLPNGALFTAQQIADDFTFMNLMTQDTRNEIERVFDQLGLDVGRIIPRQFESSLMANNNGT